MNKNYKKKKVSLIPKEMMHKEHIGFGVQRRGDGICNKELFVCFYVNKGGESPYEPMLGLSMKLGNDSVKLYFRDTEEYEVLAKQLLEIAYKKKTEWNQIIVNEREKYFNKKSKNAS